MGKRAVHYSVVQICKINVNNTNKYNLIPTSVVLNCNNVTFFIPTILSASFQVCTN